MIPLSVLDLSPVTTATAGAAALRNSLDLARLADRLGYTRYWLAEHHNLASIASSAPEVMIGQVAAVTSNIRVGSGGVMLVNHAPLMVAERFKVLEALFPGRIDLGLGRAPGTDPVTSYALRRRQDVREGDDFLERFQELVLLERGGFPPEHPFRNVHAMPTDVALPPIWLLGSSGYSAELAAAVGMGFAFAHHFSDHDAASAMQSYRAHFKPSAALPQPRAILAVAAIAADSDAEAEKIAASADLHFVRRSKGEFVPLPSPEEAADYPFAPVDRQRIARHRERLVVGSVDRVKKRLLALSDAASADELMITTMVYDHAARRRSYELLAELFDSLPEICHVQPDVAADCGGVPEVLQICRGLPLIYVIQAFPRPKRGDRRSSQLRFVPGIVFSDWVASTMMGHVARSEPWCGRGVPFNPSLLAAATAAVLAFVLATPVKPAAAQGWNPAYYDYPGRPRPRHHRLKEAPQTAPPEQVSKEPFGQIPRGPLQIIISIDQQKLHLYSNGTEVTETLVATGVPGHPTPVGVFSVIQKARLHHSNIYSAAPMPFMQRITWSGVALHEGGNLGHPASHGCVRLPHDFATRLWVLTRLGARVIIARPELRPTDFTAPHLFMRRGISPSVPTAAQPPADKPIKTAQSLAEEKTSEPKEPARSTGDTSPPDKAESAPSATPAVVKTAEATLRPSLSESPSASADESVPVVLPSAAATAQPAPVAAPANSTAAPATPALTAEPSSAAAAPQPAPVVLPVALPVVPVPPIKPAEIARNAPKTPIAIFISGKEKKIYVRQDFSPLFSAPVTIDHPERPLGTHVFTALSLNEDRAHFRWNVVSMPSEPRRTLANTPRIAVDPRYSRGKREMVEAPEVQPPPQQALARIEIPQDILDRISDLIIPGSSLIISDQGLDGETGEGTDFIVTMR